MTIRPLREEDRAAWIDLHRVSSEHFRPWYPTPETEDLDARFTSFLQRADEGLAADTGYRFVSVLPDGSLAGGFNLNNVVRRALQGCDMGWSIRADLQGRGYALEGCRAVLSLAFEARPRGLGLHRVQAGIIPRNLRSISLAERLGFRREGYAKAYLLINGSWEDHVIFAKLAEEHAPA